MISSLRICERRTWIGAVAVASFVWFTGDILAAEPDSNFTDGVKAYDSGDFTAAAGAFERSATSQPASGSFQNLGLAEWKRGRTGEAVVAWERALWLDPFNSATRTNLRFARHTAQLDTPNLAWYEVVSSWLPVNWWAWIAGLSLWVAVGMSVLPGILRWPKLAWHQALAAVGMTVFMLSLPAHLGVLTRSRIGFVVQKDTELRMTPTVEAQVISRLAPGEPARLVRARGKDVLIRTQNSQGWVGRDQFVLTSPRS
jgi:hypothetical protein